MIAEILTTIGVLKLIFGNKRKAKKMDALKKAGPAEIAAGLQKVKAVYGKDIARNVELIYRNETRHFQSGQFLKGFSPGMENFNKKKEYPYGWSSLIPFVKEYPFYKPTGVTAPLVEGQNTGKQKIFVKFPSFEAAAMFVAYTLKKRDNDPGRWHSNDEAAKTEYRRRLATISPKIIDNLA